jgi:hypothetical protein
MNPMPGQGPWHQPKSAATGQDLTPKVPVFAEEEGQIGSETNPGVPDPHVDQSARGDDGVFPTPNSDIEGWFCFDTLVFPKELGPGCDRRY